MTRLAILALRPVEAWYQWNWKRNHRKGKYRKPADWSTDQGKAAVTTKK